MALPCLFYFIFSRQGVSPGGSPRARPNPLGPWSGGRRGQRQSESRAGPGRISGLQPPPGGGGALQRPGFPGLRYWQGLHHPGKVSRGDENHPPASFPFNGCGSRLRESSTTMYKAGKVLRSKRTRSPAVFRLPRCRRGSTLLSLSS